MECVNVKLLQSVFVGRFKDTRKGYGDEPKVCRGTSKGRGR